MGRRGWTVLLSIVVGLAVVGGALFVVNGWRDSRQQTRNDKTVRAYLDLMAQGDYGAAYALVCTDETGVDRDVFERAERANPIRWFEIESSGAWSSWVDGHGRVYRVRVDRAVGTGTVEEIRTQDGDPICIQFALIARV